MSEKNIENGFRFPVFHVPHDGRLKDIAWSSFCLPEERIQYYHWQMSDMWVSELVPFQYRSGDMLVRFPLSRLQCDVERFPGPEEVMLQYGMGVCYTKVYDGTVIRKTTANRCEITNYYDRPRRRMELICERHSRVLLIDLHSYHDQIVLPDFVEPGRKMPDLCIGTDEQFTPPGILDIVRSKFEDAGFTVDVNYPYSGMYVPGNVADGSCACDFAGFMLEFHRRVYLDESGSVVPEKAEKIRSIIRQIVSEISYY